MNSCIPNLRVHIYAFGEQDDDRNAAFQETEPPQQEISISSQHPAQGDTDAHAWPDSTDPPASSMLNTDQPRVQLDTTADVLVPAWQRHQDGTLSAPPFLVLTKSHVQGPRLALFL